MDPSRSSAPCTLVDVDFFLSLVVELLLCQSSGCFQSGFVLNVVADWVCMWEEVITEASCSVIFSESLVLFIL